VCPHHQSVTKSMVFLQCVFLQYMCHKSPLYVHLTDLDMYGEHYSA
jgi:hypothetical protein